MREHRLPHPREPLRVAEQLLDEGGDAVELRLGHDDGAAAALEVARVLRLVVAGRVRVRDEDGRRAGGRELPDRAAGAGDREIRRRQRRAELVRDREHDVVLARHRGADALVVALARQVEDGRARIRRTHRTAKSLSAVAPAIAPKKASSGASPGARTARVPSALRHALVGAGNGPAGHPVLASVPLRQVVGEEDAPRERRRQPVREPEVGVGLGQRGRDAQRAGREHHRAGDVAAAAEDDVRSAPAQDPDAGCRRQPGPDERPQERNGRPPREARDRERVERVAVRRDEPSLDAIRRPGERHQHAALAQRLRHRERRQHVACRSAGRDETPEPVVRLAAERVHPRRC